MISNISNNLSIVDIILEIIEETSSEEKIINTRTRDVNFYNTMKYTSFYSQILREIKFKSLKIHCFIYVKQQGLQIHSF